MGARADGPKSPGIIGSIKAGQDRFGVLTDNRAPSVTEAARHVCHEPGDDWVIRSEHVSDPDAPRGSRIDPWGLSSTFRGLAFAIGGDGLQGAIFRACKRWSAMLPVVGIFDSE